MCARLERADGWGRRSLNRHLMRKDRIMQDGYDCAGISCGSVSVCCLWIAVLRLVNCGGARNHNEVRWNL